MRNANYNPVGLIEHSYADQEGGNYTGEWNPELRCKEGTGVYEHPTGIRYEGFWKGIDSCNLTRR